MTDATDDRPVDAPGVEAGAWDAPRYGAGDTVGSYREVTPAKRAAALGMLDLTRPVSTFSLGETVFVGYPGWGTRTYEQHLWVSGLDPGPGFDGEVGRTTPRGANRSTSLEERVQTSYNLGTKINGLGHVGVGDIAYGGRRMQNVVASPNLDGLDTTTWGPPLLTRGLLVDVLAAKIEDGSPDVLALDGCPYLRDDLRITGADIDRCWRRQHLPEPEPGDAILFRTGWRTLLRTEPERYISHSPGLWLAETRWLAGLRPALVATDSWCWGMPGPAGRPTVVASCHQELLVHHGIRVGESFDLDPLADAAVDRFVFVHNPLRAEGAVSTSSPPTAIANT